MRFDLADLRLFLHVAEAQSITHGAERSNLALASASARVRGMEEGLGVPLLTRHRHGVALSPAGQCLVEHARLLVQQAERMKGDLAAFARGLRGSVRVLSNTSALSEHLPQLLARFLAANPTISIDLEERESADIATALAAGLADVGIASAAAMPEGIAQFAFRDDTLVLILPRGQAARRRTVALADVIDRPFVGLPRADALQRHIDGHAARLGATLDVRARVAGFEALCRMVEAGAGIGIVPAAFVARYRRSLRLDVAKLTDPWAARRLVVCHRRAASLPAGAQRLIAHLRAGAR